jgi:hypothetical protein
MLHMLEEYSLEPQESLCLILSAVEFILQDKQTSSAQFEGFSFENNQLLPILLGNLEEPNVNLRKASLLLLAVLLREPRAKLSFMSQCKMPVNSCAFLISRVRSEGEMDTCLELVKKTDWRKVGSGKSSKRAPDSLFWYIERESNKLQNFFERNLIFNLSGELNLHSVPDPLTTIVGGQICYGEISEAPDVETLTKFQCDSTSLGESITDGKRSYTRDANTFSEKFKGLRPAQQSLDKNLPNLLRRRTRAKNNESKFNSVIDSAIFKDREKFTTMKGIKSGGANFSRESFRATRPKLDAKGFGLGHQMSTGSYTISHKKLITSLFNKSKLKASIERNI